MRSLTLLALLGLSASTLIAADAKFAEPVKVTKDKEDVRIEFAVSEATDCAVAIVGKDGKVVRHLVAGMLGDNAPAPLQKGSLKQALAWDGKDDRGRPAQGGPFQAKVSLGVKPTLEGFIGHNAAALGSVRSIAVGPKGEVFVFHVAGTLHPNDGTPSCSVFDREGKYLRTILPFPADLPEDRLKGLKRLTREDGARIPFLYQGETRSILPGAGDLPAQRSVAMRDGRIAFIGIREGPHRYAQPGINQVLTIRADGGVPADGFLGPELAQVSLGGASLALTPDEKSFYAAGLREAGAYPGKATHAVYRFGWNDKSTAIFVGSKTEAGAGKDRLNTPRSVAVDGKGNVYVADRGNDRIAVFQPDGVFLGAVPVDKPERVEVHPSTGALYVIGGDRMDLLQKFAAWDKPKAVAELKLPIYKHDYYTAVLALDAAAEPPILWVGTPMGEYARFDLLRIEDKGDKFAAAVDVGRRNAQAAINLGAVFNLELDRDRDRLFINSKLFDLNNGKLGDGIKDTIGPRGAGIGLDGTCYTQILPNLVRRHGPDLKLLPFQGANASARGDLVSPFKQGSMRLRGRGVTADYDGNMYILWEDRENRFGFHDASNQLSLHRPDGSVQNQSLIVSEIRSLNSVRIDGKGNIYVALGLRPGKDLLPPGLKGQLPEGPKDPDAVGNLNSYPLIYGSIAKFGPEGGEVRKDIGGVPCNYAFGAPIEVKGAKWIYSGSSPVVSWRTPGTPDICNCESPRFDVDAFGRSFFPDAARCRVGMLDTNGNLIATFGSYGNVDTAGKEGRVAVPEIPLLWPYCIAAGDRGVFVGDRLNRRVVHVKLVPTAEETRPIP